MQNCRRKEKKKKTQARSDQKQLRQIMTNPQSLVRKGLRRRKSCPDTAPPLRHSLRPQITNPQSILSQVPGQILHLAQTSFPRNAASLLQVLKMTFLCGHESLEDALRRTGKFSQSDFNSSQTGLESNLCTKNV